MTRRASTPISRRQRRSLPRALRPVETAVFALQGVLALATGYLVALLLAAWRANAAGQPTPSGGKRQRLVVLVPAYNEERGIAATLRSLAACAYPAESGRVIVIADNCTDHTAAQALESGVEVWERTDPDARGKGFALSWALDRLFRERDAFDAVVIVDADCAVSPNLLGAIDAKLRAGARAIQVDYVASNPHASPASALRFGAFALADTVRFLGKQRLGLSCGLVGTGMAFSAELLERAPWTVTGLVEDGEYHMRLVLLGERTEFVPEAWVSQAVPTSLSAAESQQARWEKGRLELIRHWSPRLLRAGLAKRDAMQLHAGVESLVPPQSVIAAGSLGAAAAGLALRSRRLLALSLLTLAAQAGYVLGGLWLVRAPAAVYRALAMAPALIASKAVLYFRIASGRGPDAWVRTERETPLPAREKTPS
jgi:hypothetical protein